MPKEATVLNLKYKSKRISEIDQITSHVKALLFRIHTITGWILPESEFILSALVSEFELFLLENYPDLNTDEIGYAFRAYGVTIKDWGKNMNLSLINEPLTMYMNERKQLSDIEERISTPKPLMMIEPVFDEAEFMEIAKKLFLSTKRIGFISSRCYDILTENKEIDLTIEEKADIRAKTEKRVENEAIGNGHYELKEFKLMKQNKVEFEKFIRKECKKQAVAMYFIKQNEIENF